MRSLSDLSKSVVKGADCRQRVVTLYGPTAAKVTNLQAVYEVVNRNHFILFDVC